MHTLIVCQNGRLQADFPLDRIDVAVAEPSSLVWLDLYGPSEADIALLRDEFGFHPLSIEDATRSHERPKIDVYPKYYFVVFYDATYNPTEDHIEVQPINLFIGANYLVTVHKARSANVEDTIARWQAPNSPLGNQVGVLVHALLDALVDDYFPLMDRVADRVEDLEDTIFVHFDEAAIQTIFGLKKDLLNLRRVVAPERDVLNVMLRRQLPIFHPEDMSYLQDVYDHTVRVTDSIDTYRDLLSSALDSYLSLQSNNLNQIVKLLTMASIVLMAGALIAGIYGMNFHFMPELGWRLGYPWALGLMVVISTAIIVYFRRKKWF